MRGQVHTVTGRAGLRLTQFRVNKGKTYPYRSKKRGGLDPDERAAKLEQEIELRRAITNGPYTITGRTRRVVTPGIGNHGRVTVVDPGEGQS